ncbi:MAG: hypothetical protein IKO56_08570, partial [Alphaproteobacteria bacterium]|nr:hypothetical protein [Alphaproteobacteria bacterium]
PLLNKFAIAIQRLKSERYQNRKRITLIISIIAIIIMSVCAFFGSQQDPVKQIENQKPSAENSLPSDAYYVLNLSKKLKPYPPSTGVEQGLDYYLVANKGADLTFVIDNEKNPTYHWKINKLELTSTGTIDVNPFYNSIKIELLDGNHNIIGLLSESTENFDHKNIIEKGKGHYFTDFWSKHHTNARHIISSIMEKAEYYTIMSNADLSNYGR